MLDGCQKCMKLSAVLFLAAGVLFLLGDLNIWNFWNIQWYTVLFVLMGFLKLGMCSCSECRKMNKK